MKNHAQSSTQQHMIRAWVLLVESGALVAVTHTTTITIGGNAKLSLANLQLFGREMAPLTFQDSVMVKGCY